MECDGNDTPTLASQFSFYTGQQKKMKYVGLMVVCAWCLYSFETPLFFGINRFTWPFYLLQILALGII